MKIYLNKSLRNGVIIFFALFACAEISQAQSQYQSYSYHFYQKFNSEVYNPNTRFHSALKPYFLDDSLLNKRAQAILGSRVDSVKKSWVSRKLFDEHLIDIQKTDYTLYADYLPDLKIGSDFSSKRGVWLNTRGYQVGGTIGQKFFFYTSGFENQGQFADYYTNYAKKHGVVPGQSYNRAYGTNEGKSSLDWSYVTALISYTPSKYLNVTFGHDKNFIGDGYRSVLLSDYSSPYTFLKLTGTLGNIQYTAMWASMQDPSAQQFSYETGYRTKGAVFHYLDWNVNSKLSIGFFDSIVWATADDSGNIRGFDWGYANPIIFLRPVEASSGSPDNALMGINAKYKFAKDLTIYGQFSLDEFEAKNFFSSNGSSRNKYAWQLGLRGADLFHVTNLNYLIEFNTAKPYTYTSRKPVINYAHYNEPLAHPMGANFREIVSMLNYSYKRFDLSGQLIYAKYGLDKELQNYGKNIFEPYTDAVTTIGNYTTQGVRTDFYFAQGSASYVLNPKYNLRLELGGIIRREVNVLGKNNTSLITIGLRSSFRNLYQDF